MVKLKQLLKNYHCDRCGDWVWRTYENKRDLSLKQYIDSVVYGKSFGKERLCKSCYAPNWD